MKWGKNEILASRDQIFERIYQNFWYAVIDTFRRTQSYLRTQSYINFSASQMQWNVNILQYFGKVKYTLSKADGEHIRAVGNEMSPANDCPH